MKTDRKIKAEKPAPPKKAVKVARRTPLKSNGKHPLTSYEHIPIGIVECSLEGKYIDVNEEFCRLTGYSRNTMLRRHIKDFTHDDDYAIDIKLHERLVAGQIPFYRLEKRYVRKNGESIWVELTRSLVRDAQGNPRYTIGVVLDISERKQVERVLRDSAERLRLATGAAQMFMWEWDFQTQSYTLADNFEQVLGFSTGLLSRNKFETVWALSPEEDVKCISEEYEKAVENHRDLQSSPYRVINPENGQIVWLEISAKIIYDREGLPERMFGVAQNITENKKTQDEIAIISRMPEENPNPVIRLRPDGNVLYANSPSRHLIEVWKQQIDQAIPDELQQRVAEAFDSDSKQEIEIEHDGKIFSFTLAPVREAGYVNLYGIDITERKRAEEKLRQAASFDEAVMGHMGEGLYTVDEEGKVTSMNPAAEKMFGWTLAELRGRKMHDITHYKHVDGTPFPAEECAGFQVLHHGQNLVGYEDVFIHKDGSFFDVIYSSSPLWENGKISGLVVVFSDNTARKQSEKRLVLLSEISEMLRSFEDPHELMYTISKAVGEHLHVKRVLFNEIDLKHDREIVYRDYHNGLESVAGVHKVSEYSSITSREVAAGKTVINADSKTDPRTAQDYEKTYALSGERAYVVVPMMRENRWVASLWVSDDTPRNWSSEEVSLLETIAERTWTVIEKLRINSERKQAEEALRRNEMMFSTLVDAAPFGVYFIDSDFRLRAINKGSEAVFSGIDPLIGRDFAEVLRIVWQEPFATEAIERFRHTLHTGESFISPPVIEQRANIQEIEAYDWQIHRITLPDGTFGVVCYFYDLSEQKQMEATARASEALYRTIARSIPGGGIYVVDKDMRYLVADGAVTDAFGLSRETLEGHTVSEVFHGEEGARMVKRLQQNFSGETISYETEHQGRVYWTQQAPLRESIGQAIIVTLDITERKRAEEALRQSEERFVQFMQHLPGLAWIKDMQGRYVYANAAAEKAFSTPREELYGKTDPEIFAPEVAAQFKRNDELALMDEQGLQVVEELRHADSVLHYSLVSKFPIPGPDGSPVLIGGTAFDITERLSAEEALRESEERFRAILRQATAGIVRKDAEGRLLFVNQAFCNMLGYTESDLQGKTIWEFMHEDDVAENKRSYKRLMLEGIPFKLERRLLREDGSVIWVDTSVSPIMDAEGKPQSAVTVEVDVTARKQAEEALQQLNLQLEDRVLSRTAKLRSVNQTLREEIAERKRVEEALRQSEATARENEEKLSTLFDLLPVGISFLDPQGRIIQMNSALPNILKLSREQVVQQEYRSRKYIRADGTPMPWVEFASARALAGARTVQNVETGILLEDGQVIWTNVSAAPVDVADVGAVVVTTDITDSKRAERALQESHDRLRILSQRLVEVQEEERRALARELHDRVGQTLAALNINLIIINSQLSADVAEQIGTRLNDSMKLVSETIALVRDVMTDLRPAVLDDYGLEAALESHIAQFTARYSIHAKLEKADPLIPRLGPSIEMTFLRIAQEALMNIARHAHATKVNLSLRREGNSICMTIQDNGIGIHSSQEANRPGSHGLTIMRERAETFSGSLRVKSTPGQGTKLEVSIPFRNDDQNDLQENEEL